MNTEATTETAAQDAAAEAPDVAHLKATAKAWEKKGSKTRDSSPAPLARNAVVIAGQVKDAK